MENVTTTDVTTTSSISIDEPGKEKTATSASASSLSLSCSAMATAMTTVSMVLETTTTNNNKNNGNTNRISIHHPRKNNKDFKLQLSRSMLQKNKQATSSKTSQSSSVSRSGNKNSNNRILHILPEDILCRITNFLNAYNLLVFQQCNKYLHHFITTKNECGWENLCFNYLWKHKIHIPIIPPANSATTATGTCYYRNAYRYSIEDIQNRNYIRLNELCYDYYDPIQDSTEKDTENNDRKHSHNPDTRGRPAGTIWSFRFKKSAGIDWTSIDPWYNGLPCKKMIFLKNGTIKQYVELDTTYDNEDIDNDEDAIIGNNTTLKKNDNFIIKDPPIVMKWRFIRKPMIGPYSVQRQRRQQNNQQSQNRQLGSYIRINIGGRDIPTYIINRSPTGNWGFYMENCWGLYTSFNLLPLRMKEEEQQQAQNYDSATTTTTNISLPPVFSSPSPPTTTTISFQNVNNNNINNDSNNNVAASSTTRINNSNEEGVSNTDNNQEQQRQILMLQNVQNQHHNQRRRRRRRRRLLRRSNDHGVIWVDVSSSEDDDDDDDNDACNGDNASIPNNKLNTDTHSHDENRVEFQQNNNTALHKKEIVKIKDKDEYFFHNDNNLLITNAIQWREAFLYNIGARILPEEGDDVESDDHFDNDDIIQQLELQEQEQQQQQEHVEERNEEHVGIQEEKAQEQYEEVLQVQQQQQHEVQALLQEQLLAQNK